MPKLHYLDLLWIFVHTVHNSVEIHIVSTNSYVHCALYNNSTKVDVVEFEHSRGLGVTVFTDKKAMTAYH